MGDKTEKKKMLNSEPYIASDQELVEDRMKANLLIKQYNETYPNQILTRRDILKSLLGDMGKYVTIEPPFFCNYGSNIHVGDGFNIYMNCVILDCAPVYIGDNFFCGPNVQIYTVEHPVNPTERLTNPQEYASSVKIGNNVWIGGGSIICPGVTIGDNTTIGAGSVVVKDIPSNVLACGNPCKVIRELKS